jgi:hypothetical protein
LTRAPALEKLTLCRVSFSSPVTIESFFTSSNTLQCLALSEVIALGSDVAKIEAVGRAFRRGIEQNETLTEISLTFCCGKSNELLLREILPGILRLKHIQKLSLDISGSLSDNTLTALRFLLAGIHVPIIQRLYFSGNTETLVALFQGLASCCANVVEELHIRASDNRPLTSNEPSTNNPLADAIRDWNGSNNSTSIKTLVLQNDGRTLGSQAGAALAECIAHMTTHVPLKICLFPDMSCLGLIQYFAI